jgi:long-chain acyl-CoA synthetase
MSLIAKFEETVARRPDSPALVFEGRVYTFLELNGEINRLAQRLVGPLSLARDENVAILLRNCPEFVVSVWAAIKSGAAAVPLNVFLIGEELAYILNDCRARILISSLDFVRELLCLKDRLPGLETVIILEEEGEGRAAAAAELKAAWGRRYLSYREFAAGGAADNVGRARRPDDLACLIYTSGTTGNPKGVMLTHGNIFANVEQSARAIALRSSDRFLAVLPLFHSFALTVCMFIPNLLGARIVLLRAIYPFRDVIRAMILRRPTVFIGVPQIFSLLSRRRIPRLLSGLLRIRVCVSGSAPLARETLGDFERNFRIPLLEGYGLTEAAPVVAVNPLSGARPPGSVGRPLPGVEVKIVDAEAREVKTGEAGEIILRGANVMKGYYRLPGQTAAALRNGWLFTGDIGKVDEEGYLYLLDRLKDLILVKGLNVYPREVEEVLRRHPGIAEASVVGRGDPHKGEIPVAVCAAREGATLDPLQVIRFCREHLAPYKVPHQVIILPDLPRTATGKILKREVRRLLEEGKIEG